MSYTKHTNFVVSTVVDKPLEDVWKAISSFNSLAWGGLNDVKTKDPAQNPADNVIGKNRLIYLGEAVVDEVLVEYSSSEHYYTYHIENITEGVFPGKFINYYATLRLYPVTDGNKTFVHWSAKFDGEQDTAEAVANAIANNVFLPSLKKL